MKIVIVIDHFHPGKGGAERSTERILSALHERGHDLHLCAMTWQEALPFPIECHRVTVPGFPRWRRDLAFAKRSFRLARELNPDLVLAVRHVLEADVFLARGGLHCETLEGNLRADPSWLRRLSYRILPKHRVFLELERRLFTSSRPPFVISPSGMVREHCLRRFGLDPNRVAVVHTGADLERFRPAEEAVRRELRVKHDLDGRVAGLFVGHNFHLKGLPALLEAWRRLDPGRFVLLVAGRGRPPALARRMVNVRFLGPGSDVRQLYQAADFLVHPTFYDPFSRVVIEALACGLPVITTRYNGAAEIVTDGREGFVLDDAGQTGLMAEKIRRFEDAAFRIQASTDARSLAERHPEGEFLNRTADLIEAQARRKRFAT